MNLKDENSKFYVISLIVLSLGVLIFNTLPLMGLVSGMLLSIFTVIGQIFVVLLFFLLGIRYIAAKNNMMGYLNFGFGLFMLTYLIFKLIIS